MRPTYLHVSDDTFSNLQWFVKVTVGADRSSGKQVAKYSRYNNGTKDSTGTARLSGTQVAMHGCYNNRTTTSSILVKYKR